jgi:hypothetical protein
MGSAAYDMWHVGYRQQYENMIDALSHVIAARVTPLRWRTKS